MRFLLHYRSYLLVSFLTGLRAVQGHEGHRHLQDTPKKCGIGDPTATDVAAQQAAVDAFQSRPQINQAFVSVVPVCFHVIRYDNGRGNIDNTVLQAQLDVLNKAYSSSSCCDDTEPWCNGQCSFETDFVFSMATLNSNGDYDGGITSDVASPNACVNRFKNANWASGNDLNTMITVLRKGDATVLNVFFTDLTSSEELSLSSYPWDIALNPETDGVVVDRTTVPGGALPLYNEGDVAVHAVGHWLGLLHTFDGGCSPSDGILDTAPEAGPYYGCDGANPPDTCLSDSVRDPIFNYMDYSTDQCTFEFTYGQNIVMRACWYRYRLGIFDPKPISLPRNQISPPITLVKGGYQEVYVDLTGVTKDITCRTTASEGDADLYLYVDSSTTPCCQSNLLNTSNEACTVKLQPKGNRLRLCRRNRNCAKKLKCQVAPKKKLTAVVLTFGDASVTALTIICG